jgi:transposase-like protein
METNKKPSNKFSPEVRARAVRMVQEHRGDHASQWAAIASIAAKIPVNALILWPLETEFRTLKGGSTAQIFSPRIPLP